MRKRNHLFFIYTTNDNRNFSFSYLPLGVDSLLKPSEQTALLVVVTGTSFTAKDIIVNSFPPLPHLWQEAGIAAKD